MIHYHGTPCGGVSYDLPTFYTKRHALVSYFNKQDAGVVMECCQTFCIDNGAFSFWRKNGQEAPAEYWQQYIDWLRPIARHPNFDWWLIPDTITGPEVDNRKLIFTYGREIPYGVPVYHFHESLEYLNFLVENFPRIALGSSGEWPNPGTSSWWNRIEQVMSVCCDSDGVPRTKLHGLRMLDPEIFSRLPLSSADSTNAVQNAKSNDRFGMYRPPTAAQRAAVIADRIEVHNSCPIWTPSKQQELFQLKHCSNG